MSGRLVVVTGTGTGIGKTHVAEALLRTWGRRASVAGIKPAESGVDDPATSDGGRLARASTFHVKQFGYVFREPISPHLAARRSGTAVDIPALLQATRDLRSRLEGLVVELPGGLFTPLSDTHHNADYALALEPDAILLVAPDRLGVLHDVTAAARAIAATPLRLEGVALNAPGDPDESTGTNAAELDRHSGLRVLAALPRAPVEALVEDPSLQRLAARLGGYSDGAGPSRQ